MAVLYTPHFVQFFDNNGNPLSGGLLYTYAAGTTTPKDTYTTAAGTIANANPVVLDSAGRAVVFLTGSYKFTLKDSLGNTIKETDNVTAFSTQSSTVDNITANFVEDVIATGDSVIFSDLSDGGTTKRDTVQGILDLVPAGAPAITLGTPQASTSGTAISFTGIPSTAKRVTIMFDGVSTTGTSPIIIRLGTSSGYETSGYTGGAESITVSITANTTGFRVIDTPAAATLYYGKMTLDLMNSTTNTWNQLGIFYSNGTARGNCAGTKSLSGVMDRIQATTAGGTDTFDAGSINIIYQ